MTSRPHHSLCRLLTLAASMLMAAVILSCGHKGMSPAELQAKLDSIRKIEEMERMRLEGVPLNLQDPLTNPLKVFYDSLSLQTLPLHYSESYVNMKGNFKTVPQGMIVMLELERGYEDTRAVRLPTIGSIRPIVVAEYEEGDVAEMWLCTLTDDYMPIDRLCVYDMGDEADNHYFAVTSKYLVYRDGAVYGIGTDGMIREWIEGANDDFSE